MILSSPVCGRHEGPRFVFRFVALALPLVFALVSCVTGRAAAQDSAAEIRWKSIEMAQLRLDDKAPLKWNVYQAYKKDKKDKKHDDLVLILLGHRYLMLDTKARLVYLVPISELHAQGQDFTTDDLAQSERVIPSTDWTQRDVGPAELYRLTLGDYGRVLEVSLPHMPDLRAFY